ncbi:hypothetical protein F4778DRAFT_768084 [Xylariomycetidae sp. FL2044]|nr:hypothetical protein F4778DRAFT_768084 [Xylariomycetidae sp. FL2044]
MAAFNPLQIFIFPFVFLVALPLALCAGFTTILAFLVLFFRLFLVYFDVGLETLRYFILGHTAHSRRISSPQRTASMSSLSTTAGPSPPSSPEAFSISRRRRQKRSGSVTPVGGLDGVGLAPSIGLERDFEGIGGWRLDSVNVDEDAADEQQWYNLNSRLDLPDRRHHSRSHSGGVMLSGKGGWRAGSHSPEGLRMTASSNSSRSRTPTNGRPPWLTKLDHDEYFPFYEGRHSKISVV